MRAIMIMFDSLNRHMLPPYGCDWVQAPNFSRLARKTVTFERSYVGSMPCMPARREIHTGRYNFLHRSWGPIEPFDDSMPEILKENGVHSHLTSDHYHYWEEGGCNYHTRYSTWEMHRGQEGDPWKGVVGDVRIPHNKNGERGMRLQDWKNRKFMEITEDQPQAGTFRGGLEFLKTNVREDNWFLQIETFDPHEPYFTQKQYKELYPHAYDGPIWDWPSYRRVQESREEVEHLRYENAALVSMCDDYLGLILDFMDEYRMWEDTLLIVNTDHGFLLGEHDWWGKCVMPFYNEVARTPLFIWDPRVGRRNERRASLVQTIDLAPTLLDFFGIEVPEHMQGRPLLETIRGDCPVREAGLFGVFGGHVNVTDGRYVYMRAPCDENNEPLHEYTLMPTHMRHTFHTDEFEGAELAGPFSFTRGCRLLKLPARNRRDPARFGTLLFDGQEDPRQTTPMTGEGIEGMMIDHLVNLMQQSDAPREQFDRLGLAGSGYGGAS